MAAPIVICGWAAPACVMPPLAAGASVAALAPMPQRATPQKQIKMQRTTGSTTKTSTQRTMTTMMPVARPLAASSQSLLLLFKAQVPPEGVPEGQNEHVHVPPLQEVLLLVVLVLDK